MHPQDFIVLPIMISVFLAVGCAVMVASSPRVFKTPWRRWGATAGIAAYVVLMSIEAPRLVAGLWSADWWSLAHWIAQLAPWLLCFRLMAVVQKLRTCEPLKRALWHPAE